MKIDECSTKKVPDCETEIHQCPKGCSFDEIETGTDRSSFMAVVGSPYLYICCGECGFNKEDGKDHTGFNLNDAIIKWNEAVLAENKT